MKRRHFIRSSLAVGAAAVASASCRQDPRGLIRLRSDGNPAKPLVIDTHAHIFNATDLQVSGFVSRVSVSETESSAIRFLARAFAPVIQRIAWGVAPSAQAEFELLDEFSRSAAAREESETQAVLAANRQSQYVSAREELVRAATEAADETGVPVIADGFQELDEQGQALASLLDLPAEYDELFDDDLDAGFIDEGFRKLNAARRFLVEMFQYRHVSAVNYFETFRDDRGDVDLITPCMVDYDWWLGTGKSTESGIEDQIRVNELIAALSGGLVHPFVSFDPLRQVVWRAMGERGNSPMDVVIDAIENRGFIGVKLYPPMGFAVFGNERFSGTNAVWAGKDWLPEIVQASDFGVRLDAALNDLYTYCADNDVAVMAHSNRSNMSDGDFEPLLTAESWAALYDNFDIVGSFGHFGGFGGEAPRTDWQRLIEILDETSSDAVPRRFADASYIRQVLTDGEALAGSLRDVLFAPDGQATTLWSRLMYGSDWKMLIMEVGSASYMSSIMDALEKADEAINLAGFASDLMSQIMGRNAVNYLGLRRGMKTRERIERFYGRHNFQDAPMWMQKVDA